MPAIPTAAADLLGSHLTALYRYSTMFVDGPKAPTSRWLVLVDALDAEVLSAAKRLQVVVAEQGATMQLDTVADVIGGADVFPVLLLELLDTRQLVAGDDVLAGLALDRSHLRPSIEHGMRVIHRQLLMGILAASEPAALAQTLRDHVRKAIYLLRALAELKSLPIRTPVVPKQVVDVVAAALFPDDLAVWHRLRAFADFEEVVKAELLERRCADLLAVLGRAIHYVDKA